LADELISSTKSVMIVLAGFIINYNLEYICKSYLPFFWYNY